MTVNYSSAKPITNSVYPAIDRLLVANHPSSPDTKIVISAGNCRDESSTFDINLGNFRGVNPNLTANTDTIVDAEVVGANGIDTGALAASKLYHVYVIADKTGDKPAAGLISLNYSNEGPIMPFGYTNYRHIGFMVTDASSGFLLCNQGGASNSRSFFYVGAQATSITAGNETVQTTVDLTELVPNVNVRRVHLSVAFTPGDAGRELSIYSGGDTSTSAVITGQVASVDVTANVTAISKLDAAGQPVISYNVTNSGDAAAINVAGFDYDL